MNRSCRLFVSVIIAAFVPLSVAHSAEPNKKLKRKSSSSSSSAVAKKEQNNQATLPQKQVGLAPRRGGTVSVPGGNERNLGQTGSSGVNTINTGSKTSGRSSGGSKKPAMPKAGNRGSNSDSNSISIGELSKEEQLKKLADPNAGVKVPGAGKDLSSPRSGGKGGLAGKTEQFGKGGGNSSSNSSGTPDVGLVTVGRGDGKNNVSKTDQQSGGKDPNEKIYDRDGNYMGERGQLEKDEEEAMWGGVPKEQRDNYVDQSNKEHDAGLQNKEEAEKFQKQVEKEEKEMQAKAEADFRERTKDAGDYVAPPAPGDDTVTKPMDNVAPTERMTKSPAEIEAEKKRQVTLGNENKRLRPGQKIRITEGEVKAKHTDGLTNPIDSDGTTSPAGGELGSAPNVNNPTGRVNPPGSTGPDGPGDPEE